MKKAKRNAVLVIIAFILLLGLAVFTGFFGIGDRGLIKYINLGLDLKGGLSVTYEFRMKNILMQMLMIPSSSLRSVLTHTQMSTQFIKREMVISPVRSPVLQMLRRSLRS